MKIVSCMRVTLVAVMLVTVACEGDDGADGADGATGSAGADGAAGSDGLNSLVTQTNIGPTDECPFGGVQIDSGVDDNGNGTLEAGEIDDTSVVCSAPAAFNLQLLHFADVDGSESTALAAVDEFSALVDGFTNDADFGPVTMMVSSGDNIIPGPRWFAAEDSSVTAITGSEEPGHADHAFMNGFGVVASAVGNHELDQGPGEFADTIQSDSNGGVDFPGTTFPYLAANIDFSGESDLSVGADGSDYRRLGTQVAGSAVVRVAGERIGLVGVSTPELSSITSPEGLVVSGSITEIGDLAAEIQPEIDLLTASGIDKIIVLSHLQQIAFEKELATELFDVDIIVAGGSNTRQGDSTDTLFPGDGAFDEAYPFVTADANGDPLLVVNVDGDYKYLGRLVVSFDANGVVITSSIDENVSGAYASTEANVTASGGTPIAEVVAVRDALEGVIIDQFENVIGHTDVFLDGRRGEVRTEETNLGNLSADSIAWYVEQCDEITETPLVIKNGGGIRAEIGDVVVTGEVVETFPPSNDGLTAEPGDVSEGHFRGTLRFDNGLVVFDVLGSELKILLENAVAATEEGATPGQFAQVSSDISFGFDPTQTAQVLDIVEIEDDDDEIVGIITPGERIRDLYVGGTALYVDGVEQVAASNTYTLATLDFLAGGGNDYPFSLLSAPNRRHVFTDDTPDFPVLTNCDPGLSSSFSETGREQDALSEYFLEFFPDPASAFAIEEQDPIDDRRVQNLSIITDFVEPVL